MELGARLRRDAFWVLDAIHGGRVRGHLGEIRRILSAPESDWALGRREELLRGILDYAVKNIPYYGGLAGYASLSDFPVVNKGMIREKYEDFMNASFDKSELFVQGTSGSTGAPFEVYQDSGKRARATADTLCFSELAHYALGNRLYFSRVWEKGTERSRLTCWKQNWVIHDSRKLDDVSVADLLAKMAADASPKNVIIFASTLASIAKFVEKNDLKPSCKVISFITLSESLDNVTKSIIEKRLGARVYSRYSNQELGIMAQNFDCSTEFRVNVASFNIELLDLDIDKPVEAGKPGRIVVTDYFNHSMPLVRYDTGDIAVAKVGSGNTVFERVEGRRVDCIYDTTGRIVSPYVINTPMHEFLEIKQYQFIQNGANEYVMLLNLADGAEFVRESRMLDVLRSYLGEDARINVKYVNEIPVLKSGKRKQVVNNYKPL